MTSLSEIEKAITQLRDDEAYQLAAWLQNYLDEKWDRQIVTDLETGKLDSLIERVEADIAEGKLRNLNEILDNS